MRICLVADFSCNPDEGMKKIANEIYKILKVNCEVYKFDLSRTISIKMWSDFRKFNPQIIHYIPGPSAHSFIFLWILKQLAIQEPKTMMTATHPKISNIGKFFIQFFKPDMILTQSDKTNIFFSQLKFKTQFFPNGVDTERFHPVSKEQKICLRRKYGFDDNAFIILHVGHIKENRNIKFFYELNKKNENLDYKIIIVGSTSTRTDKELECKLKEAGFTVFTNYLQNIQEIYQLSDIYIFPTIHQENSIDIPLSILESLACGLPVISTRFGGIKELLHGCRGIIIINNIEDIPEKISLIKKNNLKSASSNTVVLDWKKIGENLTNIYKEILRV